MQADWLARFLIRFPAADSIRMLPFETFGREAWDVVGRKVNERTWIRELCDTACTGIGSPISIDDVAIETFRLQLRRYRQLIEQRDALAETAHRLLQGRPDYESLRSLPGTGPVLALTILAEAGDLRRSSYHRQFPKYCGLDLAKAQSGRVRGQEKLSRRGNARLRFAFWFAATIAVRMRENSFRQKVERYMQPDPLNADRKRKALTAIAARVARAAYSLVKHQATYRCYFETSLLRGSISLCRAVGTA